MLCWNDHQNLNYIIYFRDFKPHNLLLFDGGRVIKIADMGISRIATPESMTEFTGTQVYISPGKKIKLTLNITFIICTSLVHKELYLLYESQICSCLFSCLSIYL